MFDSNMKDYQKHKYLIFELDSWNSWYWKVVQGIWETEKTCHVFNILSISLILNISERKYSSNLKFFLWIIYLLKNHSIFFNSLGYRHLFNPQNLKNFLSVIYIILKSINFYYLYISIMFEFSEKSLRKIFWIFGYSANDQYFLCKIWIERIMQYT